MYAYEMKLEERPFVAGVTMHIEVSGPWVSDGTPITCDCACIQELEDEVARLKTKLDEMVKAARPKFAAQERRRRNGELSIF